MHLHTYIDYCRTLDLALVVQYIIGLGDMHKSSKRCIRVVLREFIVRLTITCLQIPDFTSLYVGFPIFQKSTGNRLTYFTWYYKYKSDTSAYMDKVT